MKTSKDSRWTVGDVIIGILFLLYLFTICMFACAGLQALARTL